MNSKRVKRKTPNAKRQAPRGHYPRGWDRRRAQAVAAYYDQQSDDDAIAEAEAAYRNRDTAVMQIPLKLVPAVRKLLAKRVG